MDTDKNESLREFDELAIAYLSNSLTQEEWKRFRTLLESSDNCKERLHELETMYAAAHAVGFEKVKADNLELLQNQIRQQSSNSKATHKSTYRRLILRITASAAAIACLAVTLFSILKVQEKDQIISSLTSETTRIEAPEGSQLSIVLPDGTKVWMNAGSSLSYQGNLGLDKRTVNFDGEAYFEVSKDPERPFIIQSDELSLRVLGTSFNIHNYKDDPHAEIALKEGKIEVKSQNGISQVNLLPAQSTKLDKESDELVVTQIAPEEISTWREGKIHFHEATLLELLREVERSYGVDIIIGDDCEIGNESFSGTIKMDMDLNKVLSYIDVDRKFRWTIDRKKVYLDCK